MMAAALSRKRPSPLVGGRAKSWATGIVYALGRVNFLFDKGEEPYRALARIDLPAKLGGAHATNKSREIWERLDLIQLHPDCCLPSRLYENPLAWIVEVNGLPVDARDDHDLGLADRVALRMDSIQASGMRRNSAARPRPQRLVPLGRFVDLKVRFGTEYQPARHPNRWCSRARTSSQGIPDSGSRSCSARRRSISARCASASGNAFGSVAMLSQRSSASCMRSETLNLSNSSRGRFVTAQGYRPTTAASTADAALEALRGGR